MVTLIWERWPLAEECYKADGDQQTWILRQDETGRWVLGASPYQPSIAPTLSSVGDYATRTDAEFVAQQIEDTGHGTPLH